MASEAIKFIRESIEDNDKSFFLYLNPTVPHGSGDVRGVLENGDCRHSVAGNLNNPPEIPVVAPIEYDQSLDCRAYRQTVLDRASQRRPSDAELGMIWMDDAIGWIMETLFLLNELDNTFFLIQQDHGQEGKGSLYQQGVRMFQFVHYPDKIAPNTQFDGLTSTIDIGPTMLEFAGITSSPYEMDGTSWAAAAQDPGLVDSFLERCLFFEIDDERSVQCGCHAYMRLPSPDSETRIRAGTEGFDLNPGADQLFNVCTGSGDWIYSPAANPQVNGSTLLAVEPDILADLSAKVDCHIQNTRPAEVPSFGDCSDGGDDSDNGGGQKPCIEWQNFSVPFFSTLRKLHDG